MQKLTFLVEWFVIILMVVMFPGVSRPQTQQQQAIKAASLEAHEGVTISARPWTETNLYKEKFPKASPFSAGVLAIQVTFRNDSEESVKVGLDRIRLSLQIDDDNRQELPSLSPSDVAEAVFKPKSQDPTSHKRLPIPMGGGSSGNDKKRTELQTEAQNAAVPTSVLAPHSTVQGLLYFDLQGQFDLLKTAHLYIPDVAFMKGNRALTFFEIDLSQSTAK